MDEKESMLGMSHHGHEGSTNMGHHGHGEGMNMGHHGGGMGMAYHGHGGSGGMGGMGRGDMGNKYEMMGLIHNLMRNHNLIIREYEDTDSGIKSYTHSTNTTVVSWIHSHVYQLTR
mmetsp:Transcript_15994/g.33807  ORF Transcript_15994/g.33807 Transcript_15994/m.33807 type:complete len:116 (+) Transcript_15994:1102-1449(+)